MTPEHIHTSYADLLDGRSDRATLAVLGDLDALYASRVPATTPSFSRVLEQRGDPSPATEPAIVAPRRFGRGPAATDWPSFDNQPRPSQLRQWLAFAAAVLAFVLVGTLLVVLFRGRDSEEPRTAAPIPPATSVIIREILYVSQTDDTHRAIRAVRSDGGEPRLLLGGDGGMVWAPSWSPDGTRIAFSSSMDGSFSIYTTNADGGDLQRLTTTEIEMADTEPTWSPDGTRIAFFHSRGIEREPTDLMVMNADGSGVIALTTLSDGEAATMAEWSPDGTRIAYSVQRQTDDRLDSDIFVVNADGTGHLQLSTSPGWNLSPAWSPDSTQVAYVHSGDGPTDASRVFITDISGGQPRQISTDGSWAGSPDWSADGAWIAYVASTDTRHSIRVIRPNGTDQQEIATFDGVTSPSTVRWSPDGQQLAYMESFVDAGGPAARASLVVIDRDGANRRVLADDVAFGAQPAWSPLPADASDATPVASPTPSPISEQFTAAFAALPEDQRGCQATPTDMDSTGLPEVFGRMLVGDGQMLVQIATTNEDNRNLTVGIQSIIYVTVPESGIARLVVAAIDPSGEQELAPDWGPQVGTGSQTDGPIWRTLFTFPTPGCWQLNVIGEQSAGVAWLQVELAPRDFGTPTLATLDNLRPLEPGEGWFVRYQVWSDLREDGGALMHWSIERIERVLTDGTRQQHVTAWDESGATVAELVRDGERWWWNQRGWVEAGGTSAGIAPLPLELRAGMFEPETAYQMMTTLDSVTADQSTDGDVTVTRFHRDSGGLIESMGLALTDAFYEVRQAADPSGAVLLSRWVVVDDSGLEIEMSRHMLEHLVRTDAATMDDAEFAVPGVPISPRPMQYAPPSAPLPAGFTIDRHWSDYPVAIEHLAISGPGITLDVAISASRGGFDPRHLVWNAARAGNDVDTIDTRAAPVTYVTRQGSSTPILAIWDDGRYRFELSATPTDAASWDEAALRALAEALSDAGL